MFVLDIHTTIDNVFASVESHAVTIAPLACGYVIGFYVDRWRVCTRIDQAVSQCPPRALYVAIATDGTRHAPW